MYDLVLEGPRRLDRLLTLVEKGRLQTSIRLTDSDEMLAEIQVLVNRLVVAWLVGASLISLSVLLAIYRPGWLQSWFGPLFWLGAIVTFFGVLVLLLLVLRKRF